MSKPGHWFRPGSPAAATSVNPRVPLSSSDLQFNTLRGEPEGGKQRRPGKPAKKAKSTAPSLKPVDAISSTRSKAMY